MCGIAGIITTKEVTRDHFKGIVKSLRHRGPDDGGEIFLRDPVNSSYSVFLGHRRLSIIDLSAHAHQPMRNEDGSSWIVCNGEIYNYQALRDLLIARGHVFSSRSDTEVVIHGYEEWGAEVLRKLEGMFAFSIWDVSARKLFLAVDRFGIKPLYYYHDEHSFLFSSEVRTLLKSGLIRKKMSLPAIESYLAYGAVQAPLTIVKDVYQLCGAHYAVYDLASGRARSFRYWELPQAEADFRRHDNVKATMMVREKLQRAVSRHLVSDVPVGIFLSGGVDSSAVTILANKFCRGKLKTFSVVFKEQDYSESRYSRMIAGEFCRDHKEIMISESDVRDMLPQALRAMDQPTVDGINVYMLSSLVRREGIKVVLSGQGGDEVFGGYVTFKRVPFLQRLLSYSGAIPLSLRDTIGKRIEYLYPYSTGRVKCAQLLRAAGSPLSLYLILRQLYSPRAVKMLLPHSKGDACVRGIHKELFESLNSKSKSYDTMNAVSFLELNLYLANMLLRDGDCMSMAHGLEVRVPFLDRELVDYVFSLPGSKKTGGCIPKRMLIEAMGSLLPPVIYRRPKMGFVFPWELWLRGALKEPVEKAFGDTMLFEDLGLDLQECRYLWEHFMRRRGSVSWSRIWALYALLSWCKHNMVS